MRTAWTLIALFLLAPSLASAQNPSLFDKPPAQPGDPLLREIGAQLAAPQQLTRRFEQQKQLKILQRPLRTRGVMLYRAERGVCWHTEQPVVSTLVLERDQLRQLGEDAAGDALVIGATEQPALFGFTQIFFSLLAGQLDGAAEQFELHVDGDRSAWRIGLLPRDALLRRFVARMELAGGDQLDNVTMVDPEGDRTLIAFAPLDEITPELQQRCFGIPSTDDAE